MYACKLSDARAEVLKEVLSPSDSAWFQERFQEAAIKRYGRLQASCKDAVGTGAAPFISAILTGCAGMLFARLPTSCMPTPASAAAVTCSGRKIDGAIHTEISGATYCS